MQPSEYQAFAAALCDAGCATPGFLRAPAGAPIADRFAVYRNNVHVGLVDSLAEGFPIVRAQVGDDFFRAMARDFVQECKPDSPLLTQYGEAFPRFIAQFAPAADLPWLADLARLEKAWTESWAAADAPAMPITALRDLPATDLLQARTHIHPAARLVESAWPVADLWQAHQSESPDLASLQWRPQSVLLTRPQAQVLLRCLDESAARFTAALVAGDTIEAAAMLAPQLDAGALLAQLITNGLTLELRT